MTTINKPPIEASCKSMGMYKDIIQPIPPHIKPQLCRTGIKFDPKKYIIEEKFDGIVCKEM
jgi:ATP-dependent DNA ligase